MIYKPRYYTSFYIDGNFDTRVFENAILTYLITIFAPFVSSCLVILAQPTMNSLTYGAAILRRRSEWC